MHRVDNGKQSSEGQHTLAVYDMHQKTHMHCFIRTPAHW